jgi:demethylmenaquinone methyltransferase/2-methoxy-6-polyprenyl-1,4-benzoquinol methylase
MFDRIAPRYDRLNRVISLGLDQRWRRRAVAALSVPRGAIVLDLACGTGDLCEHLRAVGYRAVGVDVSAGMLAATRTTAPLVRGDVMCLPVPSAAVDGVVTGFALRNVVDLDGFFRECARVLRPRGRLVALDTDEPDQPLLRFGHSVWFGRVVPWLGGLLSRNHDAYRYLARSTAYLPSHGEMLAILRRADLVDVSRVAFTGGAVQLITGTRR